MPVTPYLFFNGRCEEAIEFYKKALGTEVVVLMRFNETPDPPPPVIIHGSEEKIIHRTIRIGDSTFMASDGRCTHDGVPFTARDRFLPHRPTSW